MKTKIDSRFAIFCEIGKQKNVNKASKYVNLNMLIYTVSCRINYTPLFELKERFQLCSGIIFNKIFVIFGRRNIETENTNKLHDRTLQSCRIIHLRLKLRKGTYFNKVV